MTTSHRTPLGFAALALAAAALLAPAAGAQIPVRKEESRGVTVPAPADSARVAAPAAAAPAAATPLAPAALADDRSLARARPEMQMVLDAYAGLEPRPLAVLTPEEARRQPTVADAVKMVLLTQGRDTTPTALVPGVRHADRTIPGAAGPLPARVYTPEGSGPFPVIVYFHGGGWVIGSKEVYDGGARGLSKQANAIVVSVDYRLAPEHKFPAQHDDALAAYRWAVQNAASIGGDARRVALAGESAGGNLAVATAIAARDARLQRPTHVLSVYPIAQADTTTPSYLENANAKPLDRAGMGWFARHATRTPADLQDPRISLTRANLQGLPPVTLVTAEIDPLRNDAQLLEQALRAAGVPVERRHFEGVTHEFFGMAAVVPEAQAAQAYAGERLRQAFGAR
jgi:acetyl esterase/lipase